MSRDYDPWATAQAMGLTIFERRLPDGRRGEYWHHQRLIMLSPRMTGRELRSVLTHEIQHAICGDVPSPFGMIAARQEMRARRATARVLIDPDEYAHAEQLRGPHLPSIAYELNVSIHVVRDWIAMQSAIVAA